MRLIVPMYSARHRLTGNYQPLNDGNFHAAFNQFLPELLAGTTHIVLPENCVHSQLQLLAEAFPEVTFKQMRYGRDPGDTRKQYHVLTSDLSLLLLSQYDSLVLGISCPAPRRGLFLQEMRKYNVSLDIYMLNVSTQADIEQPVDAYHDQEVSTAKLFAETQVHDCGQLDYTFGELQNANISPKQKFFRPAYYQRIGFDSLWSILHDWPDLKDAFDNGNWALLPAKMSDPEYGFEARIVPYMQRNQQTHFIFTDPNGYVREYFGGQSRLPTNVYIANLNKRQYYGLLQYAPKVLYTPSPYVYHIGKSELELFGCKRLVIE